MIRSNISENAARDVEALACIEPLKKSKSEKEKKWTKILKWAILIEMQFGFRLLKWVLANFLEDTLRLFIARSYPSFEIIYRLGPALFNQNINESPEIIMSDSDYRNMKIHLKNLEISRNAGKNISEILCKHFPQITEQFFRASFSRFEKKIQNNLRGKQKKSTCLNYRRFLPKLEKNRNFQNPKKEKNPEVRIPGKKRKIYQREKETQ